MVIFQTFLLNTIFLLISVKFLIYSLTLNDEYEQLYQTMNMDSFSSSIIEGVGGSNREDKVCVPFPEKI